MMITVTTRGDSSSRASPAGLFGNSDCIPGSFGLLLFVVLYFKHYFRISNSLFNISQLTTNEVAEFIFKAIFQQLTLLKLRQKKVFKNGCSTVCR